MALERSTKNRQSAVCLEVTLHGCDAPPPCACACSPCAASLPCANSPCACSPSTTAVNISIGDAPPPPISSGQPTLQLPVNPKRELHIFSVFTPGRTSLRGVTLAINKTALVRRFHKKPAGSSVFFRFYCMDDLLSEPNRWRFWFDLVPVQPPTGPDIEPGRPSVHGLIGLNR